MYIAEAYNRRIRKVIYHSESVNNVVTAENNIFIFPNPATNQITIKSYNAIEQVLITNTIGQIILKQSYNTAEKSKEVDIGSLSNGIYFVKVNGVYAGKFVKE